MHTTFFFCQVKVPSDWMLLMYRGFRGNRHFLASRQRKSYAKMLFLLLLLRE